MPVIAALGWGPGKKSLESVELAWQPGETVTKRRGGEENGKKNQNPTGPKLWLLWGIAE